MRSAVEPVQALAAAYNSIPIMVRAHKYQMRLLNANVNIKQHILSEVRMRHAKMVLMVNCCCQSTQNRKEKKTFILLLSTAWPRVIERATVRTMIFGFATPILSGVPVAMKDSLYAMCRYCLFSNIVNYTRAKCFELHVFSKHRIIKCTHKWAKSMKMTYEIQL